MRALIWLVALAACGDNTRPLSADAAPDAPDPGARKACLDRPTALPTAPAGQLPCELLPPGFGQ